LPKEKDATITSHKSDHVKLLPIINHKEIRNSPT